jgi:hypothetical protein
LERTGLLGGVASRVVDYEHMHLERGGGGGAAVFQIQH